MATTDDPARQLEQLAELLGSQGAVARLLGTESSRVSEWLHGVRPRPATRQRIADAAAVVDVLRTRAGGDASSVPNVLETPLPELAGQRPSELIQRGRGSEVVAALADVEPAVDLRDAERDLVAALLELARAARSSVRALQATQTP